VSFEIEFKSHLLVSHDLAVDAIPGQFVWFTDPMVTIRSCELANASAHPRGKAEPSIEAWRCTYCHADQS